MVVSRQEYWSRLSIPSPEDLSDPGIKPTWHMSPALALYHFTFTTSVTWEAYMWHVCKLIMTISTMDPWDGERC